MTKFQDRLRDRVTIVTGGAHGIGRAYAERLGQEGARVVIADLDGEGAEHAAESLRAQDISCIGVRADVSDWDEVQQMAAAAVTEFGGIDILINNAAMFSVVPMSRGTFDEISVEEWEKMMRVNLLGTWLPCKAVVPEMRKKGYGKIVNISSGTVFKGAATRIHYTTSKAGIIGFTRTLAREVGDSNITVNCIAPGSTLSQENPDKELIEQRQKKSGDRAIKRVQQPDDLVGAVAFFCSSDSDFVSGQTLVVDGGSAMN